MKNHTSDCMSRTASYSTFAFSFLAGGIAGAAVALLLAPQSGKVTREIMGRKMNDAADSARELKGRMVETLNDAADSARELKGRMVETLNDASESARELKGRVVRRSQEIRGEASSRVEDAATALVGKA